MRFALIDGGQAREIFPGQPFMTKLLVDVSAPEAAEGEEPGEPTQELQNFQVTGQWFEAHTPEALARYGIKTVVLAAAPAEGERVVSTDLVVEGAQVIEVATYGERPPPEPEPRRLIPKSLIQARLIEAGKMDATFTVLMSSPADFAKWFAPDWPNVYADDERMLIVLGAVGADSETITAP